MLKETLGIFKNWRAYIVLKPIYVMGNPGRYSAHSGKNLA